MTLNVERAVLDDSGVRSFIEFHLTDMERAGPTEARHAVRVGQLRDPAMVLWVAREGVGIVGAAAVERLSDDHAEFRMLRTSPGHPMVAARLVRQVVSDCRAEGFSRLSLEARDGLAAATRQMFERQGFISMGPFGTHEPSGSATFMTMEMDYDAEGIEPSAGGDLR